MWRTASVVLSVARRIGGGREREYEPLDLIITLLFEPSIVICLFSDTQIQIPGACN